MNDPDRCPTCEQYYQLCRCDAPAPVRAIDYVIAGLFIAGCATAAAAFMLWAIK